MEIRYRLAESRLILGRSRMVWRRAVSFKVQCDAKVLERH